MNAERLFFALWPDPIVRRQLGQCQEAMLAHARGRALPVEKLHITLNFLGSVDVSMRNQVIASAARISGTPVEFALDRFVYRKRQRMIWLGASVTPDELLELVDRLREAMGGLGIEQETRPFLAHTTMMRNVKKCAAELSEQTCDCRWRVQDFVLVRSNTLPEGAEYDVLHRFALV